MDCNYVNIPNSAYVVFWTCKVCSGRFTMFRVQHNGMRYTDKRQDRTTRVTMTRKTDTYFPAKKEESVTFAVTFFEMAYFDRGKKSPEKFPNRPVVNKKQ